MPRAPFPKCDNQKWTHTLSKCPLQDIFTPGGGPLRRHSGKESTCQCGRHRRLGFDLWVRKIPWRIFSIPVFLEYSIPAWRIPWTEEPGDLQSIGSQRIRHEWAYTLAQEMRAASKALFLLIWEMAVCESLFGFLSCVWWGTSGDGRADGCVGPNLFKLCQQEQWKGALVTTTCPICDT